MSRFGKYLVAVLGDDKPTTPYAGLIASGVLAGPKADRFAQISHDLNPAAVTRKINAISPGSGPPPGVMRHALARATTSPRSC